LGFFFGNLAFSGEVSYIWIWGEKLGIMPSMTDWSENGLKIGYN